MLPTLPLPVFNALPDAYLLLTPDLTIAAVSNAYLALTHTRREDLVGRQLFDAFPDHAHLPEAAVSISLRDSLRRVQATGQPHEMARLRYDLPDPAQPERVQARYWQPRNLPILDEQGQLLYYLLLVSDMTAQVQEEEQLHASQAREHTAQVEAEAQRNRLQTLIAQAPALIASLRGPNHVVELANDRFCQMVGHRSLVGRPYREAVPELGEQGFVDLLDAVYRTGETYAASETLAYIDRTNSGQTEPGYFNFIYQATRDAAGQVQGVLIFAYDVSEEVKARRQVEAQEQRSHDLNEELTTANEEIRTNNQELQQAEHNLRELNLQLEARVAERTQALQEALREAEHQREQVLTQQRTLQQILGQVPAAVATLTGPEHRCTFFNAHYQDLSGGRTRLGLTVAEVFPEVVAQGFVDLLDGVYRTGQPFVGMATPVLLYNKVNGQPEQHYVDFIYQPLVDEHGHTQGILAFVLDTTEKVLSQQRATEAQEKAQATAEQLAEQRNNFYQIFTQTPACIAILRGPEHRFDFINEPYQQLFPGRQLLSRPLAEALPEAHEQGFTALLDRVYQTGEAVFRAEMPLRVTAQNGCQLPVAYFTFTYQAYQEKGRTAGVSIFAFDVTEQVQARQEAAAQQAQLQALFEQAPVAVAILQGPELTIQVANSRVAQLWGRRPEQVIGKPLLEALPEVRDQGFPELLVQVRDTGQPFEAQEIAAMLERNGHLETVYFNFVYQPLHDAQGHITGVAVVATEVGEQVQARQQVQALNEQLQAANAELGASNQLLTRTNQDLDNFVYASSHDLKQPVNNLAGLFNELYRSIRFTDPQEEQILVPLIQQALQQLSVTIDDLAALGQAQQASEARPETVSLAELTEEVLTALEPQVRAARARITTNFDARPTLSFPRANLRTVLLNLLSNSLKYADPERPARVHLSVWVDAGQPVLVVQDNGLGFDADRYREELFHLFRRLHQHTAGTGVGLYLVNRIVQANGGHIEVESQVGAGATFRIWLGRA
ncbi:PAS domain-containing protein [Hymenobacter glacieicola]|uniref:histidine kinase n=1 Tax=Hymenobacter glacieicola TaxID=1562124 RepID=A0ABQ1WLV4_9BACT|nr:PAS domain-containing protein [Hymenobacter glacieicola]GGG37587.1 hypothetical protein GCM10011378_12370 [Hymenobacter glacieicola]